MKRTILIAAAALLLCLQAAAQTDTLRISAAYTTHIIFSTDLTYADLSNSSVVAAKIVEQNKNMLALKARNAFKEPTSVSALESNGVMHTWIVEYDPSPASLIIDTRAADATSKGGVSRTGHGDAPVLSDVIGYRQGLFHLGETRYDISVLCENIYAYSDITYIVLSLKNDSGVSYSIGDATFVVESKKKSRRTVIFDKTLFPRSRYGSLSAAPGETARIAYSFDKMTLSDDQVLNIYFYETDGQRNLKLTVDTRDINRATKPL